MSTAEIIGPSGRVHYRRPPGDPMIAEAEATPGYRVRIVDTIVPEPADWPKDDALSNAVRGKSKATHLSVKTYEVAIDRPPGAMPICARTRSQALYRAFRQYREFYDSVTFGRFLNATKITRVPNPAGIGDTILVDGRPATRILGSGHYVWFLYEGSSQARCAHPNDVRPG